MERLKKLEFDLGALQRFAEIANQPGVIDQHSLTFVWPGENPDYYEGFVAASAVFSKALKEFCPAALDHSGVQSIFSRLTAAACKYLLESKGDAGLIEIQAHDLLSSLDDWMAAQFADDTSNPPEDRPLDDEPPAFGVR